MPEPNRSNADIEQAIEQLEALGKALSDYDDLPSGLVQAVETACQNIHKLYVELAITIGAL